MKDIVSHIIDSLKQSSKGSDTHVHFSQPYRPIPIDKINFLALRPHSDKKIAFVDGGNAELLQSSHFSLQLIRVYGCIYSQKKKITSQKSQLYAFIHTEKKDGSLTYCMRLFGNTFLDEKDLCFEFKADEDINELSLAGIGQLIRRCAELAFAKHLINTLEKDSIIILDGSLQCHGGIEKKYMDALLAPAHKNQIIIGALSKTTGLMTNAANSVASALSAFNVPGKWIYYPVADIEDDLYKAELSFVKLHEKSRYVFKFEINKDQNNIHEAASSLSSLSSDPIFLGYPYGLIDADMHARISKAEKQQLMLEFKVAMGKDWKLVENSLNSSNAHEILDRINYS